MIALLIMTADRVRVRGAWERALPASLCALCLFAAGGALETVAAPPARPVPSTGAPHPSAPVVKFAGMTLEIRLGRVVVTDVAKGSPAERAGIRPLDVLLVANDRSLVDLDPISPQQVLGLLRQENTLRTRLVFGRGAGTLTVDLPRDPGGTEAPPQPPVEIRPGVEAPLFTGRDLKGREVSLNDLRGRLVLLDFWASTCPPCARAVIPLRRISEQHEGKVEIVGFSLDEDRKAFEAFVYNHHLPGIQIFDGAGWRGTIARLYGVPANGIPHYVLIDEKGRIAAVGGLPQAEEAIARLIREAR